MRTTVLVCFIILVSFLLSIEANRGGGGGNHNRPPPPPPSSDGSDDGSGDGSNSDGSDDGSSPPPPPPPPPSHKPRPSPPPPPPPSSDDGSNDGSNDGSTPPPPSSPPPKSPPPKSSSGGSSGGAVTPSTATDFDGSSGSFAFCQSSIDPAAAAQNGQYIVAVNGADKAKYMGHALRVSLSSDMSNSIVVNVADYCADSDCNGCCTTNAQQFGNNFLMDFEENTAAVFFPNFQANSVSTTVYFQDMGMSTNFPCTFSANAIADSSNSDIQSTTTVSARLSVGAIVGTVIGAVAFVVIIVVVLIVVTKEKPVEQV